MASDREDTKLREVAVASYGYRHEAEFAAGFLEDAGIPYRLQIDDPALGISMSTSAKIWVAAMDERRARAVLDQELALEPEDGDSGFGEVDGGTGPDGHDGNGGERQSRDARGTPPSRRKGSARPVGETTSTPDAAGGPSPTRRADRMPRASGKTKPDLTLRQRLISLGGSVAVASTLGLEAVQNAGWAATGAIAVAGAGLALAAMMGRAPRFLERILAALSGDVP